MNLNIKLNKEFFVRRKRELLFGSSGVLLLAVLIFLFIFSVGFLTGKVNIALETKLLHPDAVRFQTNGLWELGLISPPTSPTEAMPPPENSR